MREGRNQAASKAGEEPGVGKSASRRRGDPETGCSPAATPPRAPRRRGRPPKHPGPGRRVECRYAPKERRRLLVAFARSEMKGQDSCATVGVSTATPCAWKRRPEEGGLRGSEMRGLGARLEPARSSGCRNR